MRIHYLLCVALLLALTASAQTNSYTVTPIVNNTQDSFLVNPWGMSRPSKSSTPEGEWWVSDNATGYTTLYYADKTGGNSLVPLQIMVPSANGTSLGTPTGTAYNPALGPGPGANNFTYVTLDGTISNWNAGQTPVTKGTGCYECHVTTTTVFVNNSATGASYTGLGIATNATSKQPTYYAANFAGGVEGYNATTFAPVTFTGTFKDSKIPTSYKPYGVQAIGSFVWVTFFNGTSGGYVDKFDTNGNVKLRLAKGFFDEPWGVVQAPANFGAFSSDILVGNTTSGLIAAFNPTTGAFAGYLQDSTGANIVIPGLWAISFGNGNVKSGPTNTLYYTAGGNYTTGVFGAITAN
jgi:uncharacterized protein (TIGR03118 family)